MIVMAPRKYRLHDGSIGTEYDALLEIVKLQEARKQRLEDEIEILKVRLGLAEGHP